MVKLQQLGIQVQTWNSTASGACWVDIFSLRDTLFRKKNKRKNLNEKKNVLISPSQDELF